MSGRRDSHLNMIARKFDKARRGSAFTLRRSGLAFVTPATPASLAARTFAERPFCPRRFVNGDNRCCRRWQRRRHFGLAGGNTRGLAPARAFAIAGKPLLQPIERTRAP